METYKIINSVGLGFDIVGVFLIWRYALPRRIETVYDAYVTYPDEIGAGKKYKLRGKLGLIFIMAGFSIQIVSNFF